MLGQVHQGIFSYLRSKAKQLSIKNSQGARSSIVVQPKISYLERGHQHRYYALIKYTDVVVKPAYEKEPVHTIIASLRQSMKDKGKTYCRELRKKGLIPAILNRGKNRPYLLEVSSSQIWSIMNAYNSRFLGRRYLMKIKDTNEVYEVLPQHLDVEVFGYYPKGVTFTLWDPSKATKMHMPRHIHDKYFPNDDEWPSLEEIAKAKKEGTYVYRRFLKSDEDDKSNDEDD